jgi:hypothetical protein
MKKNTLIVLLLMCVFSVGQISISDTMYCVAISNNVPCNIRITGDILCKYHGGDINKVKIVSRKCLMFYGVDTLRCHAITRDESELCIKHKPK